MEGYHDVIGVDVSEEQVALAKTMGVEVVQSDLLDFLHNSDDGAFDVIFLMDVIEHHTIEQAYGLMDEIYRSLAPGGCCILHTANADGLYSMGIRYGDVTHEMALNETSARQLLTTVGFHSVKCHEDVPSVHGIKSMVRFMLWHFLTTYLRLLWLAETGSRGVILSRNFLIVANR